MSAVAEPWKEVRGGYWSLTGAPELDELICLVSFFALLGDAERRRIRLLGSRDWDCDTVACSLVRASRMASQDPAHLDFECAVKETASILGSKAVVHVSRALEERRGTRTLL